MIRGSAAALLVTMLAAGPSMAAETPIRLISGDARPADAPAMRCAVAPDTAGRPEAQCLVTSGRGADGVRPAEFRILIQAQGQARACATSTAPQDVSMTAPARTDSRSRPTVIHTWTREPCEP
ncbi:hypothetical protein [Phenylobacterium sp. SCN 70-31]|uniref:hypothetical protein n=1 Tax=Phenylobacterium sp. SCN 70-31 TaxID=1660129 RepID=UPI00086B742B|nr:hypothetical protein [Phenylobacterium sp. SCN 70-31]ODT89535.1 MAG: hypothetical protein ABS78_01520 [Phenylobacterium sp. SCN 70-31]